MNTATQTTTKEERLYALAGQIYGCCHPTRRDWDRWSRRLTELAREGCDVYPVRDRAIELHGRAAEAL